MVVGLNFKEVFLSKRVAVGQRVYQIHLLFCVPHRNSVLFICGLRCLKPLGFLWIWLPKNRGFSLSVSFFFSQVTPSLSTRHVCCALGVFMGVSTRDILPPLVQHVRIQSCALDWQGQKWQHTHRQIFPAVVPGCSNLDVSR